MAWHSPFLLLQCSMPWDTPCRHQCQVFPVRARQRQGLCWDQRLLPLPMGCHLWIPKLVYVHYARKQWNQKQRWRGCSHVVQSVFTHWLWREMSFLLKVRCHLLAGNLCVPAGLLLWVPPTRAGLFQCDCSPSQALSFPAPCSCLASVLMLLRCVLGSAQGRGHGHVAAKGLGKEECAFLAWKALG